MLRDDAMPNRSYFDKEKDVTMLSNLVLTPGKKVCDAMASDDPRLILSSQFEAARDAQNGYRSAVSMVAAVAFCLVCIGAIITL